MPKESRKPRTPQRSERVLRSGRVLRTYDRSSSSSSSGSTAPEHRRDLIKYGPQVTNIYIGDTRFPITVHEDLLCQIPFFRNRLQQHRLYPIGGCPICDQVLDQKTQELTYCKSPICGANVHISCMKAYLRQHHASRRHELDPLQCPACHEDWEIHKVQELRATNISPAATAMYTAAFKKYKEWLYTARMPCPKLSRGTPASFNTPMIGMYKLATALSDTAFQKAILTTWVDFMEINNRYPSATAVAKVYDEFPPRSPVRWLFVEVFATKFNTDWWEENWKDYPKEMIKDVLVKTQREENVVAEMHLGELKNELCHFVDEAAAARETQGTVLEEQNDDLFLALVMR